MRSVATIALLLLFSFACEDDVRGGAILPELTVTDVTPPVLVPGTRMQVSGTGFVGGEVSDLVVIVRGAVDGAPVEFAITPERVDDETLVVSVAGQVLDALIPEGGGTFVGSVSVMRQPKIDAPEVEVVHDVSLRVARVLTPTLTAISATELYVGDTITLSGDGFLYPHEGASLVELSGTMTTDVPRRVIPISGLQLPAEPPDPGKRDALTFTLTPDILGIVPGRFEGQVRVVNTTGSGTTGSEWLTVSLPLEPPYVTGISPTEASRGQWIHISGRGFVAPDGLLQAAMVLLLEGTFTPTGGPAVPLVGPSALSLVPDLQVDNTNVSAVLRVAKDAEGELRGLGLRAGRFEGTITPLILFGPDQIRGRAADVVFDVLPQKQVIYLRALPSFDEALAEFGLASERSAVQQRILAVTTRDYAGVSIEFTWQEPTEYAEYGIVELAGHDPNGTGLFGLDNTEGKDVGNLRFDDIIGGYNAATQAGGYAAYGGVFAAEFMNLSAHAGNNPLSSTRFDDIFGPVVPALGGKAAKPGESSADNSRGADIREAVRVYGNLVGSTISHEVGHSLGLANVDGQFHNIGDNPGWLMDAGSARPFEERAEIDGQGPGFFEPNSLDYLKAILPLE